MAKVILVIYDDEDGNVFVEMHPDPDFDTGSEHLEPAQHMAMHALAAISDEDDVVIAGDEYGLQ